MIWMPGAPICRRRNPVVELPRVWALMISIPRYKPAIERSEICAIPVAPLPLLLPVTIVSPRPQTQVEPYTMYQYGHTHLYPRLSIVRGVRIEQQKPPPI